MGQQISVNGAVTQLKRIVRLAGPRIDAEKNPELTRFFPNAADLARTDLSVLGMPQQRKTTLAEISRQVAAGGVSLDVAVDLPSFIQCLTAIPGIGDWTANYVAMRALGEPDAFPASDLGIRNALRTGANRPTARQTAAWAEAWRPWRAYAAAYLWLGGGKR